MKNYEITIDETAMAKNTLEQHWFVSLSKKASDKVLGVTISPELFMVAVRKAFKMFNNDTLDYKIKSTGLSIKKCP